MKEGVLILFLVAVIVFAPLVTIWALNTVFSLGVAYTFWTWLGILWLQGIIGGAVAASGKS